jgi:uncharacterized protein YjiS (DUF1127 family)
MARIALPLSASNASATALGGWAARAFLTLELALQVRKERRMLRELGAAGLKDIGLNSSDVHAEFGRSFWDVPVDRLR